METELYVGNLPGSTRANDLKALFAQVGDVTAVNMITDRLSGGCKGYAYVTMSAQSEADKAVSMLNMYSLKDHELTVTLVKPREQRGFRTTY
ncbi:MAG: RNA recognition motif domain-containing protein [Syntrophothermus sp.]|jgi:RNA recognition motif-containing protein